MRQIVTGLFETYDDARRAQDALLLKGFANTDIELPVPGTEPPGGAAQSGNGVLAGLERFVSSFFASRAPDATGSPATARSATTEDARAASLRFALQRGAVLIGVRVADETHAALARDTLMQQQAIQVDDHAPDWQPGAADPEALRERSALDELGIGGLADALRQHAGRRPARTVPDEDTLRTRYDAMRDSGAAASTPDRPADDPAVTALAPAETSVPPTSAAPSAPPASVPDEFVEYEEDFRGHHAMRYGGDSAPFERYEHAYRYGAALAQDLANEGRAWDEIEPEARRGWETMATGNAPHRSWEEVRDAARHGWERAGAQGTGSA